MISFEVEIRNPIGLHARPASIIVKTANQFVSDITIIKDNQRANAKSIIAVLALGAKQGTTITFEITGPDENEAFNILQNSAFSQLSTSDAPSA